MSEPAARTPLQRYQRWRRWAEAGFWVATMALNAVFNTATTRLDLQRAGVTQPDWAPLVAELTSAAVWLALLLPAIAWFTRRHPLHAAGPRGLVTQALRHLAASIAVSWVHVAAMVALRVVVHRGLGSDYDFGSWPQGLYYEYLKDARSYLLIVAAMESYRLLLRRAQGELRVLDAPEPALAGPPQARDPERQLPPPAVPPEPEERADGIERPRRFLVRKLNREFLVAADDIAWLHAEGNYVSLRVNGHDYLLRSTLAGFVGKLDPQRFARIHRGHVVNLDRVASIEPLDSGDARVHLDDGSVLPCSRRYRDALRGRGATG